MSTDPKPERARRTQLQETLDTLGAAAQPTERTEQGPEGPPALPPTTPDVPAELAGLQGYEIVKELGRGGMGVVYLARNKLVDRPEVLKVMSKALVGRPAAVERFLQEIRSAGQLIHGNVATTFSAHQLGDLLVLAMEYVEGDDLAKVVRQRGPLPVANACYCVHQAATALQRGFELGLVHRDIKPSNILLAKQGKRQVVKVIDFGLAKARSEVSTDRDLTGTNQMMGTPGYSAPEQLNDAKTADTRSDIYALGCTLYYLLAGAPPFKGNNALAIALAQEAGDVRPLREVRPEVPEGLARLVARMMAREPAERFGQPGEVVAALLPFVQGAKESSESSGAVAPVDTKPARPAVPPQAVPPAPPTGPERRPRPARANAGAKKGGARPDDAPVRLWPYAVMIGVPALAMLVLAGVVFKVYVKSAAGDALSRLQPDKPPAKADLPAPPRPSEPDAVRPKPLDCTGPDGASAEAVRRAQDAWAKYPGRHVEAKVEIADGVTMTFVLVPPGKFHMGSPPDETFRYGNETLHEVTLTEPFDMGKYEVTQAQYEALTGNNPSGFKDPDRPVECVTWNEADAFGRQLTAKLSDGHVYRLPTEAEWEYSCRGGRPSSQPYGIGDGRSLGPTEANFNNVFRETCKVGSYAPNALGLYDMHGNVWEWCADWNEPYPLVAVTNPLRTTGGPFRVARGGCWNEPAKECRSALRQGSPEARRDGYMGFRLARSVPSAGK
jgi:formylglycine-generating enzyme required for sulfatase activity